MKNIIAQAPNEELTRLEILRVFKKRFGGEHVNDSPFTERIVKFDDIVADWDVPEIHHDVREAIEKIIKEIAAGQPSKIVILAGEAGMGKSHLLNYFRTPKLAQSLGYILIGNSNHWKVQEFESCLLDWILDALLKPSLDESHLLLDKIEAIAFAALRQILERPGQLRNFTGRKDAGFWQRQWAKWFGSGPRRFQQALQNRNVNIFRSLHFHNFADFVIKRFLPAQASKPFHRHVLKCLLRYLFPEEREKVIQWLRRQEVEHHFVKQLGIGEAIDMQYKVIDTIHVLISLFTPEVSKILHPDPPQNRGLVFCFAFDQMEGRQELFEEEEDWNKFFGKLSELYNTLPNVFFIFTMTLGLREKLYHKMEKQFQHRIQRDQKYVLREIRDQEILASYRRRIDRWLGDTNGEIRSRLQEESYRYLPFHAAELLDMGQSKQEDVTLRGILERIDDRFRKALDALDSDNPRYDYLVSTNDLREKASGIANDFSFTKDHLANISTLMNRAGDVLASFFGMQYNGIQELTVGESTLKAIRLEFRHPVQQGTWIRVFVIRLGTVYRPHIDACINLLYNLTKDQNFLWIVRPAQIDAANIVTRRPGQVFVRVLQPDWECCIQAVLRLLDKRDIREQKDNAFQDSDWKKNSEEVLQQEIRRTYLGEMLQQIAGKLGVEPVTNQTTTPISTVAHEEIVT